MKLKYEMAVINSDGVLLATPVESNVPFAGIIRINEVTADILELLKTDTTEDELVNKLFEIYDTDKGSLQKSVKMVVDVLNQNNLLSYD